MTGPAAGRASSAIGSMIFAAFGGAWLVAWSIKAFGHRPLLWAMAWDR